MRKLFKLLLAAGLLYLLLVGLAAVAISGRRLKVIRRPLQHGQETAAFFRDQYGGELQEVNIQAADAAILKAWYIHPKDFNGNAVILLHGLPGNREEMVQYGGLFLHHGYAILLPDARGQGESGGEMVTYGMKESDDIHRWVSWIYAHDLAPLHCVYGFGESYGASLILQSLSAESRFCAVVAESPYSTQREVAYERISRRFHFPHWLARTAGWPVMAFGEFYLRSRYGIDLRLSPLTAIIHSRVPTLLVHGQEDVRVSPNQSVILAKAAPDHVQLWLVPNTTHTAAWSSERQEFERRVLGWFAAHPRMEVSSSCHRTAGFPNGTNFQEGIWPSILSRSARSPGEERMEIGSSAIRGDGAPEEILGIFRRRRPAQEAGGEVKNGENG